MSTLVYPQLATGALSQYPVRKTRRTRTVINQAADGSTVRLADTAGGTTEWQLAYAELSDDEAAALEAFFAAAEGSLQSFTFLDPAANLLAWSEQPGADVWQKDPQLAVAQAVADPAGGTRGWRLTNQGAADQAIAQTLAVPGAYTYCFSVYVRAAAPATVRLGIGDQAADRVATSGWGRAVFVAAGTANTESLRFSIAVPAGQAVEIYGPQVEAQGGASVYRPSTTGGVYADAHLRDDTFRVTRTDFNRNSCTVNIIHADHL
ncbi:MAG: DUF2460 domain-containing protein [Acidobacteria bacterium]|nr:DUF2460 domain-containing protein [Acidobacteriota bacterium]